MGNSNIITFRLRVGRDNDLQKALEGIPNDLDRSDVIRTALRAYFYSGKVNVPSDTLKRVTSTVAGFSFDNIELKPIEKSAKDLNGALDSLLKDF